MGAAFMSLIKALEINFNGKNPYSISERGLLISEFPSKCMFKMLPRRNYSMKKDNASCWFDKKRGKKIEQSWIMHETNIISMDGIVVVASACSEPRNLPFTFDV